MKRSNLFKRSAAMLLAGLMAVSMSACGGSSASGNDSGDSQASSSGDTHKLSVVLKTTSSEYWSYVIAGIEQAEKDLGNVEVDVRGANSDTDFDGQLNMVETIVNADMCEAIAIAPLQADQIANALTGVKIPVLAIDTNFDQAETFIGTAHEDAAYQGGKYVAEKIGKGGKVIQKICAECNVTIDIDRLIVPLAVRVAKHDLFCLVQIRKLPVLQLPQDIALCQRPDIIPGPVNDRHRTVLVIFHFLHRLSQRIIIV